MRRSRGLLLGASLALLLSLLSGHIAEAILHTQLQTTIISRPLPGEGPTAMAGGDGTIALLYMRDGRLVHARHRTGDLQPLQERIVETRGQPRNPSLLARGLAAWEEPTPQGPIVVLAHLPETGPAHTARLGPGERPRLFEAPGGPYILYQAARKGVAGLVIARVVEPESPRVVEEGHIPGAGDPQLFTLNQTPHLLYVTMGALRRLHLARPLDGVWGPGEAIATLPSIPSLGPPYALQVEGGSIRLATVNATGRARQLVLYTIEPATGRREGRVVADLQAEALLSLTLTPGPHPTLYFVDVRPLEGLRALNTNPWFRLLYGRWEAYPLHLTPRSHILEAAPGGTRLVAWTRGVATQLTPILWEGGPAIAWLTTTPGQLLLQVAAPRPGPSPAPDPLGSLGRLALATLFSPLFIYPALPALALLIGSSIPLSRLAPGLPLPGWLLLTAAIKAAALALPGSPIYPRGLLSAASIALAYTTLLAARRHQPLGSGTSLLYILDYLYTLYGTSPLILDPPF